MSRTFALSEDGGGGFFPIMAPMPPNQSATAVSTLEREPSCPSTPVESSGVESSGMESSQVESTKKVLRQTHQLGRDREQGRSVLAREREGTERGGRGGVFRDELGTLQQLSCNNQSIDRLIYLSISVGPGKKHETRQTPNTPQESTLPKG